MFPEPAQVERFRRDLDALAAPGERIGIAVSGGPDSLALLLLASAARPAQIEAATIDHLLRPGSADEAAMAAEICSKLGVPHRTLEAEWGVKPQTGIQERAREERYRLLAIWARDRCLDAIATAHHLDDQAETFLMRLARGAGVRGLAAMRPISRVPGSHMPLIRPLLGWRRSELAQICLDAGLEPASDPSNEDDRFERVRVRHALAHGTWADPQSLASTVAKLGEADAALEWSTDQQWAHAVTNGGAELVYDPGDSPREIRRRIVARAVERLASEGRHAELRGRELDRLLRVLGGGGIATIRGVRCSGGACWRFVRAPARNS